MTRVSECRDHQGVGTYLHEDGLDDSLADQSGEEERFERHQQVTCCQTRKIEQRIRHGCEQQNAEEAQTTQIVDDELHR